MCSRYDQIFSHNVTFMLNEILCVLNNFTSKKIFSHKHKSSKLYIHLQEPLFWGYTKYLFSTHLIVYFKIQKCIKSNLFCILLISKTLCGSKVNSNLLSKMFSTNIMLTWRYSVFFSHKHNIDIKTHSKYSAWDCFLANLLP